MSPLLDSLIAQWRRCGGDKCRLRNCPRCERGIEWRKRHPAGKALE